MVSSLSCRGDASTSVQHRNAQGLCGYTNFHLLPTHTYIKLLQLQKVWVPIWQALPSGRSQSAQEQVLKQMVGM